MSVSNLGTSEQQVVFVLDKEGNLFKVEGAVPQNNVMGYQGYEMDQNTISTSYEILCKGQGYLQFFISFFSCAAQIV